MKFEFPMHRALAFLLASSLVALSSTFAADKKDKAKAERVFNALCEGGDVTMPFAQTFWSPGFGMCVDRFGIPWMVNTEATP